MNVFLFSALVIGVPALYAALLWKFPEGPKR